MKHSGALLVGFVVGSLLPLLLGLTNSVPHDPLLPPPPDPPADYIYAESTNTWEVTLVYSPRYEWQITFEHSETVDFAEVDVYPIVVQVPFESETGFVRVVARKVEVSEDVTATTR